MSSILALTLWPEWAWAITHLGKRVENRSERFCRQIARRVGDGWLAIHAGVKRPADLAAVANMWNGSLNLIIDDPIDGSRSVDPIWMFGPRCVSITDTDLPRGAIVALVKLGEVLPPGVEAPWKVTNSAALRFSDVFVLGEPIPCKGAQGLWTPTPDVQDAIAEASEIGPRRVFVP